MKKKQRNSYADGGDVDYNPPEPPQQDRLSGIDDPVTRGSQEAVLNIAAKSQALANMLGEGSNKPPIQEAMPQGGQQVPPPREIEGILVPAMKTQPTQHPTQGPEDMSRPTPNQLQEALGRDVSGGPSQWNDPDYIKRRARQVQALSKMQQQDNSGYKSYKKRSEDQE